MALADLPESPDEEELADEAVSMLVISSFCWSYLDAIREGGLTPWTMAGHTGGQRRRCLSQVRHVSEVINGHSLHGHALQNGVGRVEQEHEDEGDLEEEAVGEGKSKIVSRC